MNESRFAVKRFVNDTRPVGMLLPCFGFRIKPVRQNERPSAIVCHSPIFRDTGQVKSQVEAHDHSLIEYRFEKHFLYELGAGAKFDSRRWEKIHFLLRIRAPGV